MTLEKKGKASFFVQMPSKVLTLSSKRSYLLLLLTTFSSFLMLGRGDFLTPPLVPPPLHLLVVRGHTSSGKN